MGTKAKIKLITDLLMTVLLLLLMAFELVGRAAHEWIGMGMLALFELSSLQFLFAKGNAPTLDIPFLTGSVGFAFKQISETIIYSNYSRSS